MPKRLVCYRCDALIKVNKHWFCKELRTVICSAVIAPMQLANCQYRPLTNAELLQNGKSLVDKLDTEDALNDFDKLTDFMYPTLIKLSMYKVLKAHIKQQRKIIQAKTEHV